MKPSPWLKRLILCHVEIEIKEWMNERMNERKKESHLFRECVM